MPAPYRLPANLLRDMKEGGVSDAAMAALFACNIATVQRARAVAGIARTAFSTKPGTRVGHDLDAARLLALRTAGLSMAAISRMHGVSIDTVKHRVSLFGLARKYTPSVKVGVARQVYRTTPTAAAFEAAFPFGRINGA